MSGNRSQRVMLWVGKGPGESWNASLKKKWRYSLVLFFNVNDVPVWPGSNGVLFSSTHPDDLETWLRYLGHLWRTLRPMYLPVARRVIWSRFVFRTDTDTVVGKGSVGPGWCFVVRYKKVFHVRIKIFTPWARIHLFYIVKNCQQVLRKMR